MHGHTDRLVRDARRQEYAHLIFLMFILGASLVLNVTLGWRVRELRSKLPSVLSIRQLPLGSTVPAIEALDLAGRPSKIAFAGSRPTIVYVFTPQCGWCQRNLQNAKALADQSGKVYRFVGLSLTDFQLSRYLTANNITFPVYMKPSQETIDLFHLGATPETLVISTEAKLLKNWMGSYGAGLQKEIEAYFEVTLPGLLPAAAPR